MQAFLNSVPSDLLAHRLALLLAMIDSSPIGPAARISASSGSTGIVTRIPVFSVSIVMTPLLGYVACQVWQHHLGASR